MSESNFTINKRNIIAKIKDLKLNVITDSCDDNNDINGVCSVLGLSSHCVIFDGEHKVSRELAVAITHDDVDEYLESLDLNYSPE